MAAVSVQGAGQTNWISAVNTWGAQWEVNNMPGNGPYNLYIVLADNTRVRLIHPQACPGCQILLTLRGLLVTSLQPKVLDDGERLV